jgi:antitoxin component YwqK of YwqJK toxin-antitoxin module
MNWRKTLYMTELPKEIEMYNGRDTNGDPYIEICHIDIGYLGRINIYDKGDGVVGKNMGAKAKIIEPQADETSMHFKKREKIFNEVAELIIKFLEENIHTNESGIETIHGDDGSIYEGQLVNGIPSGRGRFIHREGFVIYMGHWKNGLMNGYGTAYYPDGSVLCEGEYRNGKIHGLAKMFDEEGNVMLEGYFENSEFKKPLK